jgi:hypothetical protein
MDVTSTVDSLLLPHIERTVTDAKEKLIEAVRHRYRSQDEIGVLMKFPDRTSLHKTIAEMAELGVIDLKEYVIGKKERAFSCRKFSFNYQCTKVFQSFLWLFLNSADTTLDIGTNTISFAKSWLHFCQDVMHLVAPDWQALIETAMCEVILAELKHMDKARKKISSSKILQLIDKDLAFLLGNACKAANHIYKRVMGDDLAILLTIVEEYTGQPLQPDGPGSAEGSPNRKPPVPLPRSQIPTSRPDSRYTTSAEFV